MLLVTLDCIPPLDDFIHNTCIHVYACIWNICTSCDSTTCTPPQIRVVASTLCFQRQFFFVVALPVACPYSLLAKSNSLLHAILPSTICTIAFLHDFLVKQSKSNKVWCSLLTSSCFLTPHEMIYHNIPMPLPHNLDCSG